MAPLTPKLQINLTQMIYFLGRFTYCLTQAHQSIPSHETECSCQIVITYSNFVEGTTDPSKLNWPKRVSAVYWIFGTLFYPCLNEIKTNIKMLMASCCQADTVHGKRLSSCQLSPTYLSSTLSSMVASAKAKKSNIETNLCFVFLV